MNLTPLDILQRKFSKRWRGLDPDEVKDFVEVVAAQLEEVIRENRFLEEELKKANNSLAAYREREDTLKETMITAQKVTQDMKENVKKEAEIITGEAKVEAEQIVNDARARASELAEEVRSLENQRLRLESEIRGVIETHLKILDAGAEKRDTREKSNVKYLNPQE